MGGRAIPLFRLTFLCLCSSFGILNSKRWRPRHLNFSAAVFPRGPKREGSIRAIALDMDGTLMSSHQTVSAKNVAAVEWARRNGKFIFIASGRTRTGAMNALGAYGELLKAQGGFPGVYCNGLLVYGQRSQVLFERALDTSAVAAVAEFCRARGLPFVGYSREEILCDELTAHLARMHNEYKEALPLAVGDVVEAAKEGRVINKMLIFDDPETIAAVRPALESLAPSLGGRVVQAVPDMIEVLPEGASKAEGIAALLKNVNIDPEDLMAVGDGENDIEMIQLAGVGVAVANAQPKLKAFAKFEVASNDEDGVAEAICRFAQVAESQLATVERDLATRLVPFCALSAAEGDVVSSEEDA
uniref:Uncharacterized protein n=1 Tax=Chromera velia CCMP2878 TaxID=1169474 RepID=A0A0G4H592_9ALVE|eukprot:Cvel_5716.t1-p1 / transcript=Cvel_5716.t1 / gene=Cvel_5716 / organism=Chromera_velia_CCMP2878 / gene_product=Phosphatase YidA, putative / transcript_product=Phosphatase YidA, putative / location=Cvel_scaffold270:89539-94639(+) / protein_length=357 / sequence_SO=supercontig / SO=protein_coding / is_pseudo=false